jgi:HAD superfamily hydrolase (TIGR01549 family)
VIRAAIFDFGGTIAYHQDPSGLARAQREAVLLTLTDRGVRPERGEAAWTGMLEKFAQLEHCGVAVSAADAAGLLAAGAMGQDADPDLVATLRSELEEPPGQRAQLALREGALDVLTWLDSCRIRLGLLSNTGFSTGIGNADWMRKADILPLFVADAVLFSDQIGVGKPDAGAFAVALERLGVAAAEAVHIGDDLWFDVYGGRAAGLLTARVAGFTRSRPLPDADLVVGELPELRVALAERLAPIGAEA